MDEDTPNGAGLSKKEKKKLAKKLKNGAGEGVEVSASTTAVSVTSTTAASPEGKKDKKEKKEKKTEAAAAGEKQTLPGGLIVLDAKKGSGKAAKKGSTLVMRYIGKLENGKVFDKNVSGSPVSIFPFAPPSFMLTPLLSSDSAWELARSSKVGTKVS